MKKNVAIILTVVAILAVCTIILFTLLAELPNRRGPDNIDSSDVGKIYEVPNQRLVGDPSAFENYAKIIETYRRTVSTVCKTDYYADDTLEKSMRLKNQTEKAWFSYLYTAVLNLRYDENITYGYAMTDLNGDRVDELLLTYNESYLIAVFTLRGGHPMLIERFQNNRSGAYIDAEGLLHVSSSNGAASFSNYIYKLSNDGFELTLLDGIGAEGISASNAPLYYKLFDGEKVRITSEEYDFWQNSAPFKNKNDPDFKSVNFDDAEKNYSEVIAVYSELVLNYLFNKEAFDAYVCPEGMSDELWSGLYSAAVNHSTELAGYCYSDINRDGVEELIFLDSSYKLHAILTYVDQNVKFVLDFDQNELGSAIAENGDIYNSDFDKPDNWFCSIQRLNSDGSLEIAVNAMWIF